MVCKPVNIVVEIVDLCWLVLVNKEDLLIETCLPVCRLAKPTQMRGPHESSHLCTTNERRSLLREASDRLRKDNDGCIVYELHVFFSHWIIATTTSSIK